MNKRGAGISLIAISAFLFASRHVSAAIFGSGVSSWNAGLYDNMLNYVGNSLSNFGLATLLVGIVYLIWGEFEEIKSKK
ncbi:MAG: hypothetical protein KGZ96_07605 [Clostridia bacterium]|jgi:hypothetical protein|nr:hypothetical protein [Clostridia bacterium]